MTNLPQNQFIKPYPQSALNGELGLNAADIAKSLGVKTSHVIQKLKRHNLNNLGIFKVSQQRHRDSRANKIVTSFSLNTPAAKYVVATWKNEMGIGYFQYLLQCEKIVEEQIPLYKNRIRQLIDYIAKPKRKRQTITMTKPRITYDMFGNETVVYEKIVKQIEQLESQERENYKQLHRTKVIEGLNRANRKALEKGWLLIDGAKN